MKEKVKDYGKNSKAQKVRRKVLKPFWLKTAQTQEAYGNFVLLLCCDRNLLNFAETSIVLCSGRSE